MTCCHPAATSRSARAALLGLFLLLARPLVSIGQQHARAIELTVLDPSGLAVSNAEVTVREPGLPVQRVWTDYAGRCQFHLRHTLPYSIQIERPGFYAITSQESPASDRIQEILTRQELLQQQVQVTATAPGIDTQQPSDQFALDTPEIVNIPYPTSRDIRNLLPFFPGVIADPSGQVHVAGSEYWQTLYTIDNFDMRSPASGELAMRVSTDAVRSLNLMTTRYPVQYGRATGGVIAYYTGTGSGKFRFNATDFIPSARSVNGLHFDKFVPRFTFSGPVRRNRVWFFDGLETEYDEDYVPGLPANADTAPVIRGSNFLKLQGNLTNANSLTGALLFNDYHAAYEGLSTLVPRESTQKHDTIAWLPYVRDQQRFAGGKMLDVGFAVNRFHDGYVSHGNAPYQLTPEVSEGSYFDNVTGISQRQEGDATLFIPRKHWFGSHDISGGADLDHINFGETQTAAPVNYLREDGTLLRQSTFPSFSPFLRHNADYGAFLEDQWNANTPKGLVVDPGIRFDWDEIVRRPLLSPRIAMVYAPGSTPHTELSAGIGVYYEHTQLEYLIEALDGARSDVYYDATGTAPATPPLATLFTYREGSLRAPRAINASLGVEQKLPGDIYAAINLTDKHVSDLFTFTDVTSPAATYGNFQLNNSRTDHDYLAEAEARKAFGHGYTLFGAYTWSYAHTNSAIEYLPSVSLLGPQQSGPLAWDTPNRFFSWGWLPLPLPMLHHRWDFVYSFDWHTGYPITSTNANDLVVGAVGSHRFPDYLNFSPGLEWRFHVRGYYFGLRGFLDNATDRQNPTVVNANVDSPEYLQFTEPLGRSFTARIRLIQ